MPNFTITNPIRLNKIHPNVKEENNQLMRAMPHDIRDHFGDIIQTDSRLESDYVATRYESDDSEKGMNAYYPERYPTNASSRFNHTKKMWELPPSDNSFESLLKKYVPDAAQRALIMELRRLAILYPPQATGGSRDFAAPTTMDRIIFLQAGIGSGKSTMLHHLSRLTLPKLESLGIIAFKTHIISIDLNSFDSRDMPVPQIWTEIVKRVRLDLEFKASLNTAEGWSAIAQDDLILRDGHTKPRIVYSKDPEKERRAIIYESKKDLTFLERATRYLRNRPKSELVILILDNLDIQSGTKRQLAFVNRLKGLLGFCPFVLGVVALREYTLGDLDNMDAFQAYLHCHRVHMTAPLIGEMVQKRFDTVCKSLSQSQATIKAIPLQRGVSIRTLDVREILKHLRTAFQEPVHVTSKLITTPSNRSIRHVSTFLHHLSNSNSRFSLLLVLEAMLSWALKSEEVVQTYFWQRDNNLPIKLPPFTVDELLRLCAVGKFHYYDRDECQFIFNVFSFAGHQPHPDFGRFPCLIIYRILQYFDARPRVNVNQFLEDFQCFGYSKTELSGALSTLITSAFLESADGSRLANIEFVFNTRKLRFYFHHLSKMLVYIEHMRNDAVIEYNTTPHEVRDKLVNDVQGVLDFICYIMHHEIKEYEYVVKIGVHLEKYRNIATVQPICWKLFRSVVKRLDELFFQQPAVFHDSVDKIKELTNRLRFEILNQVNARRLWPHIPPHRKSTGTRF